MKLDPFYVTKNMNPNHPKAPMIPDPRSPWRKTDGGVRVQDVHCDFPPLPRSWKEGGARPSSAPKEDPRKCRAVFPKERSPPYFPVFTYPIATHMEKKGFCGSSTGNLLFLGVERDWVRSVPIVFVVWLWVFEKASRRRELLGTTIPRVHVIQQTGDSRASFGTTVKKQQ